MFRRFSVNFALFSLIMDAVIVITALLVATHLRPMLSELPFASEINRPMPVPWPVYPIFPTVWVGIFLMLSLYDGRKNYRIIDEISGLTLGSILAAVSMAGMLYFSFREISRVQYLTFVILAFIGMLSFRFIVRASYRLGNWRKAIVRRVLIIGAGPVGKELNGIIERSPYFALEVVGFLDDNPQQQVPDVDLLGGLKRMREIVKKHRVDDVVIALPSRAYERVNGLVSELHDLPVKVWIIPDYFHLALHKAVVEDFAGLPMLDLRAPALNDYQRMIKRAFDLTVLLVLMPFILLVMGVISVAILIEGRGPILFRQPRVGENGRIFEILKFRTMVPDAENLKHLVERYDGEGNLIHKTVDDPRVTKVGRFLRRTSLDEIPQFINILKGEMSLVGPRPEMPYLVEMYEPWQRKRFAVPQGMTGWWQVNGRSDKPMHLNTEEDLFYVQNYSLQLDLLILLKTILVVLRGKGAF